jgi:hypothetical protein
MEIIMRFFVVSAGILVFVPAHASAQSAGKDDVPIKKLVLAPAMASVPALKHRLLPTLSDMRAGNAALLYQRAHSPEWFGSLRRSPDFDKMHELLDLPLAKLPRDKAQALTPRAMLSEIDLAARRTECDWEWLDRIKDDGFALLIPDVQSFRSYGQLLSLRTRLRLLDRDFDQAVHSLQTHFALSRHVGDAPILINLLVGNAIATHAMNDIEELVQVPGSPNLFWPLADLPKPFLSLRKAMEGERMLFDAVFPGIRDALKDPRRPPLNVEQMLPGLQQLAFVGAHRPGEMDKLGLVLLASRSYPRAKQYLLEHGFRAEQIEEMPVLQAALMLAVADYDRLFDEMAKWHNQPPWVAREGMRKSIEEVKKARLNFDISVLPTLLIPAMERVRDSQVRLERRLAMLQTIEAIRLYAAENGGKLPATLADVKDLPLPPDPQTGQPFEYSLTGNRATLVGPAPPGVPASTQTVMRYELTVAKGKGK